MNFNRDHFIARFAAIPEDQWCTRTWTDSEKRHCVLGHLPVLTFEYSALINLFQPEGQHQMGFYRITDINDGMDPRYPQPTPRARILAALKDLPS